MLAVTAGPAGAQGWEASFTVAGKRTGEPIVHGTAIAGSERTEGKVTTGLGSSLILGASLVRSNCAKRLSPSRATPSATRSPRPGPGWLPARPCGY